MEECQKEDSWLLEITSVEQQDFVVKLAKVKCVKNLFLPFGMWIWIVDVLGLKDFRIIRSFARKLVM